MAQLTELVEFCDAQLMVAKFNDYAPNGLQIEGRQEIAKLVTGVSANQALIDAAVAVKADALLVHHGFFWKGESPIITGLRRRRIGALIENNISLIAYHLPLDGHDEMGNNAQWALRMGWAVEGRFGRAGDDGLAMHGLLARPMSPDDLSCQLEAVLGRRPLHLPGREGEIRRIGWCSGAAQGYIDGAIELGLDAFVSGEVSEYTTHVARESGVHYFAAGHHATERYGVQALGECLARRFGICHEFIDISNPV